MAIFYVDEISGNDVNNGLSFANRKKTLSSVAAAGAAAGDTIRVMGRPSTSSGINATFTNLSGSVTLASALTQNVYTSGAAWTPVSARVDITANQPGKLSSTSACKLDINSTFTTGKAAHFATGTLNLSTYQQLSFWIKATAPIASGVLRLDLCSDSTGNTPVDQLTLPAIGGAVAGNGDWHCITIDKGANFGSSIQSIRLFAISDPGAVIVHLDDIIACKAAQNSLTLSCLVSSDNTTFYAVKSINGNVVKLEFGHADFDYSQTGIWWGTTGLYSLSILQPITRSSGALGGTTVTEVFNNSGVAGNPITISGGWNTTDMSTQDGITLLDSVSNLVTSLALGGNYVALNRFAFTRSNGSINFNGSPKNGYSLSTIHAAASVLAQSTLPDRGMTINGLRITNSNSGLAIPSTSNYNGDNVSYNISFATLINTSGISIPSNIGSPPPVVHDCVLLASPGIGFDVSSQCSFYNNTANDGPNSYSIGFRFVDTRGKAYNLQARNNGEAQIKLFRSDVEIYGLDTNFNLATQIKCEPATENQAVIYSWTPNVTANKVSLGSTFSNNVIASHRESGSAVNNNIYTNFGTITTSGVTSQSGAGIAWKLSPNANAFSTSPLSLSVGKVNCPANVPTTITYYAKLSAAGPTAQFRIFGGQYPGVGSAGNDIVSAPVTGTSWSTYSLTFTASEACVVEVFFEAFGSSTQSATVSGPALVTQ